jgi:hypothetical protein
MSNRRTDKSNRPPHPFKDVRLDPTGRISPEMVRILLRNSAEYKSIHRARKIYIPIIFALFIVSSYFILEAWLERRDILGTSSGLIGVLGALWAAVSVWALAAYIQGKRRVFIDRLAAGQVKELQEEEERLAQESEGGTLDLTSLWFTTQKRIDVYHNIATAQAESSFKVGRIAAISGFVSVLALGALAAFAVSTTAAIAASVVGASGAAMGGYIGATFMKAQAQASAQLRQFFLQPVETARLLGIERLLTTLEPEHRADAVMELIRATPPLPPWDNSQEHREPTT